LGVADLRPRAVVFQSGWVGLGIGEDGSVFIQYRYAYVLPIRFGVLPRDGLGIGKYIVLAQAYRVYIALQRSYHIALVCAAEAAYSGKNGYNLRNDSYAHYQ
jgi:hypothetical protein